MKKFILILCVLFSTSQMIGQENDKDAQREKIKALKVAFLTQELNLNDKLAEKFWPIYNEYESKKRELHKREHIELENVECIDENKANDLLDEFLSVENEEYKIKKQLFKDLKQIISAKDIIKLHKLEDEFHKKLIKEYRSKQGRKENNGSE
ncbi:hypothetical protein [Christiangramia forsetii]|uniref:Uncharacterized protein n=2 Tax=Christiangramia forsetii TaxID=411153 RepID=A0M083_CHRFK|nr:hypothetical protein [Christiangramia forsetii]GGG41584.1 hypothetical protein GCM10011532_26640 [Christiangramia forsetii]CAL66028.1 conserved hypothetical protein [Christiangramia forsetii KT0803]